MVITFTITPPGTGPGTCVAISDVAIPPERIAQSVQAMTLMLNAGTTNRWGIVSITNRLRFDFITI